MRMIWRAIGVLTVSFLLQAMPCAGIPVSGLVFEDLNQDGKRDEDEPGIPQVSISDGVGFCQSDGTGLYQMDASCDALMPAGSQPILTMSFPSGWWPTAGWFRRLDEATDPARVDFGLKRQEQSLPFTFLHASDPHVPRGGPTYMDTFRADVKSMSSKLAFCIFTGDVTDHGDREPPERSEAQFEEFAALMKGFPVPVFITMGNHDAAGVKAMAGWDRSDPRFRYGLFCREFGPLRWSFNYAGVHFVGINFGEEALGAWQYVVPETAAMWLDEDLDAVREETRVFLFVHFPSGGKTFQETLVRHDVDQILAGHSHDRQIFDCRGVPCVTVGSLAESDDEYPAGYELVCVRQEGLDFFCKGNGDPRAIVLDQPRADDVLRPGGTVSGGFFDPEGRAQSLNLKLGELDAGIPFDRLPLWGAFEVVPDLAKVVEGERQLSIAASDGQSPWSLSAKRMVQSGVREGFRARKKGVLELGVIGVDVTAEVRFNGETLGEISKTRVAGDGPFKGAVKGAETVRIEIPKSRLRQLNTVEITPGKRSDGSLDPCCVSGLQVLYKGCGRDFRDNDKDFFPLTISDRFEFLVDLNPDD